MKKVLIICNTDGALYNFRLPLIRRHIRDGFEVTTFSNDYDSYFHELIKEGCKPIKFNFHKSNSIISNGKVVMKALKEIKNIKPDIIHIYTLQPIILLSIPFRLAGYKNIYSTVTGLGSNFNINVKNYSIKQTLILLLLKFSFKANKSVLVQNNFDYNMFLEKKIVPKKKLFKTNGSGIDLKVENAIESLKESRIKSSMAEKIVLFPSRGLKEKGLEIFAQVAKIVTQIDSQFKFIHVGGLPEYMTKNEYLLFAKEHNFEVHGYQKNIDSYFRSCEIVLLPSMYREGTPKSLIEAIYFNKKIITSNIPGCQETVIHDCNGFLVEAGDVNSFVSFILKSPLLDEKLKNQANIYLLKKYDVENIYKTHLELYNKTKQL